MRKYKIFISGVQKELKEERRAIKDFVSNDVLLRDHFDVFLFEDHPAKGKSSEIAYLDAAIRGTHHLIHCLSVQSQACLLMALALAMALVMALVIGNQTIALWLIWKAKPLPYRLIRQRIRTPD